MLDWPYWFVFKRYKTSLITGQTVRPDLFSLEMFIFQTSDTEEMEDYVEP